MLKCLTTGKSVKNKTHVNLLKLYTSPLTEDEKKHVLKENEEGTEMVPTGRALLMEDAQTNTEPISSSPEIVTPSPAPPLILGPSGPSPHVLTDGQAQSTPPPLVRDESQSSPIPDPQGPESRVLPQPQGDSAKNLPSKKEILKHTIKPDKAGQFKEILDERFDNGNLEYLISKYPDRQSGDQFRPEWVPNEKCPLELLRNFRRQRIVPDLPVRENKYNLRKKT